MSPQPAPVPNDGQTRLLKRYDEAIAYYWKAGTSNRRRFQITRYLTVILGALVTLVASLASSSFLKDNWGATAFAVATPILAALTAIVAGISQSFQWGAAWSDMAITATRLQRERNRVQEIPPEQFDALKEGAILDDLVLGETQGFFQRLLGSGGPPKDPAAGPSKP